jgi:hypothetical protein
MDLDQFRDSLQEAAPGKGWSAPLAALWWDAKGEWARAHGLVDDLETPDGMAVHAYLHRKEGEQWNADYWYRRAGTKSGGTLDEEWKALAERLMPARD